jgi:glycogen operon protein
LNPDGLEMGDDEWNQGFARCLGAHLSGGGLTERDEFGKPVEDDHLLLLLNAHDEVVSFRLASGNGEPWQVRVDTDSETGEPAQDVYASDAEYPLQGRSLVLLCRPRYR